MKNILIAGGSGFIGRYLTQRFKEEGYNVSILSRKEKGSSTDKYYQWDPDTGTVDIESLKDQHIIINLAGAGIADMLVES